MRFKLLTGKHSDEYGLRYKAGDVVPSIHRLDKLFKNKFKLLEEETAEASKPKKSSKGLKLKKKAATTSKTADKDGRGTDVTDQFDAGKLPMGVRVFKRGPWFHVYKGNETTPLNDKGLKKNMVYEFLGSEE